MNVSTSKFTIFFEDPFWVGVFERNLDGKLEVCRVVFGAEPKDSEVHEFILTKWNELRFSSPIESDKVVERHINPKRLQRMIKKETQTVGIGTKAQQAIKLQLEMNKSQQKTQNHQKSDLLNNQLHQLHQQKRKEKHKGH